MMPDMTMQYLGVPLCIFTMPPPLVTGLLEDSKTANKDYSDQLVGQIDKQLEMTLEPRMLTYFNECAKTVLAKTF